MSFYGEKKAKKKMSVTTYVDETYMPLFDTHKTDVELLRTTETDIREYMLEKFLFPDGALIEFHAKYEHVLVRVMEYCLARSHTITRANHEPKTPQESQDPWFYVSSHLPAIVARSLPSHSVVWKELTPALFEEAFENNIFVVNVVRDVMEQEHTDFPSHVQNVIDDRYGVIKGIHVAKYLGNNNAYFQRLSGEGYMLCLPPSAVKLGFTAKACPVSRELYREMCIYLHETINTAAIPLSKRFDTASKWLSYVLHQLQAGQPHIQVISHDPMLGGLLKREGKDVITPNPLCNHNVNTCVRFFVQDGKVPQEWIDRQCVYVDSEHGSPTRGKTYAIIFDYGILYQMIQKPLNNILFQESADFVKSIIEPIINPPLNDSQ